MAEKDMAGIMASPEVQKAIAEAAAKAAAAAVQDFAKGKSSVLPVDDATRNLFSEMAQNIAAMTQQGSGRAKPLAPEIMAKREKAAVEMAALLDEINDKLREAHHSGDQKTIERCLPKYRVTGKCYFKEQMFEPVTRSPVRGEPPIPTVINWSGPPNHSLHPKNEIARRLVALFRDSVGSPQLLKSVSGPNGGHAAPDRRPYWLTVQGHVVQGNPPDKAIVIAVDDDEEAFAMDRRHQIDPEAAEQYVLGTVAQPARKMAQVSPNLTADQLARQQQGGFQSR